MGDGTNKTAAAAFASEMQQRTRKERRFDEMEAQLPNPSIPTLQTALLSPSNILSYLGSRNPFGKPVTSGDIVWLLDNTAFKHSRFGSWQAEFVACVFEKEPKCSVVDIVSGIAKAVGLADDAEELKTIEERLQPFLWDVRPSRQVRVLHGERELRLGPTGPNGISTDVVKIDDNIDGSAVRSEAVVPRGTGGIIEMDTFYAAAEGWAVLSDIDDTIKVTQTSDPTGILRETFVNAPTPIGGMPQLYRNINSILPKESPWFYLSASPYNLYPFLREFCRQFYPPGMLILRDSSWKTVTGLLSALTLATEEYKADRMRKVHTWLPKKKMILIGDSTQSDPEAYGDIYREFKGWVKLILIRKATDIAAVGIQAKNEPERFEKAFKGIPKSDWHVFEDPAECEKIVQGVVGA